MNVRAVINKGKIRSRIHVGRKFLHGSSRPVGQRERGKYMQVVQFLRIFEFLKREREKTETEPENQRNRETEKQRNRETEKQRNR